MRHILGNLATGSTALAILLACRSLAHAEQPPEWNCYADDDCSDPAAPYCDLSTGDCQPCLVDEHCGVDYVCDQHMCIPKCVSDMDCVAPEGYCSPEGLCLECLEDDHCPANEPLCMTEPYGECVVCIVDEDCTEDTPICGGLNTCIECLDHADCPEAEHCSATLNACLPDTCEPGGLSCTHDGSWVVQCDEFGSREIPAERCPNEDCQDGACGSPAGTEAGTSEGQDGTAEETGDPGVDSPGSRGCSCDVERDDPPLAGMGLVLLALFGWRSRRRS